ncbi:hypothetical protein [Bacteroides stercorirosoris]|uniref:Uncharacterized protein n=1 Tax=Bacteroides stercorirosoris TaxID=871324 RepID=A0A1M6KKJ1_9BACE|nr:hypothetical protein [Bacteroides stercorirosoris]SHJ59497.1 hypothetical protein SAMN05444350_13824 [Bacteroides stercorirosoris]
MKYNSNSLLLLILLSVSTMIKAQTPIRPYSQWEATQFIAVNGHQPEDYVMPDNNWEILYNLRTPRTLIELREMGIKCSDSQLLLLEVGGLISKTKGKWKTTIPILDKEQTHSLRSLSKEIAESMYAKTKADFISLTQTISKMGFKNNTLSLVFSYLLDGRMWTKLVLFEDVDNHTSWSGCYWVLYEPRNDLACGTNGFGEQNLILTYVNSDIAPSSNIMDHCADEIAKFGKIADTQLISQLKPYGLVDNNGNVLFPIIKKQQDSFHQINEKLANSISTELKNNRKYLTDQYGIDNEKVAMVMLYHEVMWTLVDNLIQDKIISIPAIFKDEKANKKRLNEVLFFIEGGLMQ